MSLSTTRNFFVTIFGFSALNKHFQRNRDNYFDIPMRAYGLIDNIEFPTNEGTVALVSIDLIGADWLDLQISNNAGSNGSIFHTKTSGSALFPQNTINPLEHAPLFRLELELSVNEQWFGMQILGNIAGDEYDEKLASFESEWLELTISQTTNQADNEPAASLYPTLFSDPLPVIAKGTRVQNEKKEDLAAIFSLHRLPEISTERLAKFFLKTEADSLAVYDVGQGNANALMSNRVEPFPTLYFDLGAGVYRNKHTTPSDLKFCFTKRPTIILSHWDADHWTGAYAASVSCGHVALEQTWVAPLQKVSPIHLAFALDVLSKGGSFFIYHPRKSTVGFICLTPNIVLRITAGTGADRNGSGLVLAVENSATCNGARSWILTGDCEYKFFLPALTSVAPVAIVAPHHGANLHGGSVSPSPVATDNYKRLIYSFGPNNRHGRSGVQHPTSGGMSAHASWLHGKWTTGNVGYETPGADILATSDHSPTPTRGGALVGWDTPPSTPTLQPCHGSRCTTTLLKS